MNHDTNNEPDGPNGPERHHHGLEPRIYVASLSDYNAGRLHGTWIDADDDPDDIHAAIADMLGRSIEQGAEEYAIHDFEGFGAYRPHEYEPIDTVGKIARGIRDHGVAYSHWVDHVGTTDLDELDRFEDHYLGRWDSTEAFVEELLDDFGIDRLLDEAIPGHWRAYVRIDTEMLARDLATEYTVSEDGNGIYLFEA